MIDYIEKEVASKGGLTIYLGTDDVDGQTSLSQVDLFEQPLEKLKTIQNLDEHSYSFYEKMGYQIVGVIPDANGWNQPNIWMAKRVGKKDADVKK